MYRGAKDGRTQETKKNRGEWGRRGVTGEWQDTRVVDGKEYENLNNKVYGTSEKEWRKLEKDLQYKSRPKRDFWYKH